VKVVGQFFERNMLRRWSQSKQNGGLLSGKARLLVIAN